MDLGNLGTNAALIGYSAGLFDSTDSSRKQQVAADLAKTGFSPDQADAIIRAIQTYSSTAPGASSAPASPTEQTRLERLIPRFTDSLIPLAIGSTVVMCVIGFVLLASS